MSNYIPAIKEILEHAAKSNMVQVAKNAIEKPAYLKDLIALSLTEEGPYCWRAAWVLRHICEQDQEVLRPYLALFIQKIGTIKHHSQLGGFLYVLNHTDDIFFDESAGHLVNTCYEGFNHIKNPYYIKLSCAFLLYKISEQYPLLKNELLLTIESRIKRFEVNHSQKKALDLVKKLRKEVKKMNI